MSSTVDLLINLQSNDPRTIAQAEQIINRVRDENLGSFLGELITVARNEEIPPAARQMALLLIKNNVAFNAREEQRKKELENRWKSIDPTMRSRLRNEMLNTLGSQTKEVRFVAALVVANFARLDLPRNEWPELLDSLFSASKNSGHMEAAITTLGYICEESNTSEALGEILQHHSNKILECVMEGMRSRDAEVCYQSTNAMCNSITFIHGNMTVEAERNYIMQIVCSICVDHEPRTIVKGLECLVNIAAEYYEVLTPYMGALFNLTTQAIKSNNEAGALQGFQFWTTICEVEVELIEDGDSNCQNYAGGAASHLVPVCLECLLKQEDEQTDEDWNPCAAAGVCLQRFAQVLGNDIVGQVMPFVAANVQENDWRKREGSIMAFGCILDGPDTATLGDTIAGAIPALLQYTRQEQHPLVRDSSVWTIARIANFHPEVIVKAFLDPVMGTAAGLMDDSPAIANKACSIVHNLCIEFETDDPAETNPLSQYFIRLVQKLIQCIDRPNAHEANLRGAAQETLNSLLSCAAIDVFQHISSLIPEFVNRIDRTFGMIHAGLSSEQLQEIHLMQGLMCGSLQHICRKLGDGIDGQQATSMMNAFQRVLSASQGMVQEEALMAVGAIAFAVGNGFLQFLEALAPYMYAGLKSTEESNVCHVAIGVVGDIMSALGSNAPVPFCDEVMAILLTNIRSDDIPRNTRPMILSCFGDIALHSGEKFEKYLSVVMNVLESAAKIVNDIDPEDEEMVEFGIEIKESICEAYTGIIQGMKNNAMTIVPYIPGILQFIGRNGTAKDVDDKILQKCVSVAGDILNVFSQSKFQSVCPPAVQSFVKNADIQGMVTRAAASQDENTRETAQWAREQVRPYL